MIEHFGKLGPTVILSDGDEVFQPRKIQRLECGARSAVEYLSIFIREYAG